MFESHFNPPEESRRTIGAWGATLALLAALGSLIVYELTNDQCSGGPTEGIGEALDGRNGVCRALGLPVTPGGGGHLLLVGVLMVPPLIALTGTLAGVYAKSFRPIGIALALCTVAGLGLIVVGGNAGVHALRQGP
jgi:hypothetical protein